jgi:large-conductance mechanosensitive channel
MIQQFRELRGDVVDLAVAVVAGASEIRDLPGAV